MTGQWRPDCWTSRSAHASWPQGAAQVPWDGLPKVKSVAPHRRPWGPLCLRPGAGLGTALALSVGPGGSSAPPQRPFPRALQDRWPSCALAKHTGATATGRGPPAGQWSGCCPGHSDLPAACPTPDGAGGQQQWPGPGLTDPGVPLTGYGRDGRKWPCPLRGPADRPAPARPCPPDATDKPPSWRRGVGVGPERPRPPVSVRGCRPAATANAAPPKDDVRARAHANTQTHGHVNTRTRRHVNTLTREHGRPARGAPCLSAPSKAAFALSPHPQTPAGRGPLSGEHRRLPPRTSRETRPWTPHERRGRAGPGPNRPSTGRPTGGPGRAPQPGG